MKYYHFTGWNVAEIKKVINKEFETKQICNNYWEQQLSAEIKDAIPDLLKFKNLLQLRKECVFEGIRETEFSHCPSRKRCIFLFHKEIDPRIYAKVLNVSKGSRNLIVIEVIDPQPRILRVDMRLLDNAGFSIKSIANTAIEYWKGTDKIHHNTETLYEGKYRIVKFIKKF